MTPLHLQGWTGEIAHAGNPAIAAREKTAFLCSRRYPASAVLRIYDWAKAARDAGECVMSGFHSALERDVLEILLRGEQPLVLAPARGLQKTYPPAVKRAMDAGRLLVLSPFPESERRKTGETSRKRNRFMIAVAARVVVGHAGEGSGLLPLLGAASAPVEWLGPRPR